MPKLLANTPRMALLFLKVPRVPAKSSNRQRRELTSFEPNCLSKTLNSLRKKKLEHWDKNKESNRDWLALNMMTEGKAGFRAFNEGPRGNQEVDFIKLRQMLAEGHEWNDELIEAISPQFQK